VTMNDEVVSKSRQRRLVTLALKEDTPILAQLMRESRSLLTEHVADVVEGAQMRIAARRMLTTPIPAVVSARLSAALFGGVTNPAPSVTVEVVDE
jgi:hypothetical protein